MLAATGLLAGLCAAVGAQHGMAISSRSGLLWGATGLLGFTAIAALVAAARLSDPGIVQGVGSLNGFLEQTRIAQPNSTTLQYRYGLGMIAVGIALFVLNSCWVLNHQDPPDDDDQMAYLMTAQEIQQSGGLSGLWRDLWSGQFAESNRHPLLLAMQSVKPTVEFGRMVACLSAFSMMGIAVILVWHRFGPLTAGVMALLTGSNGAWVYHTPRLVCECLLTGICGIAWIEMVRRDDQRPAVRAGVVGALIGLAWLTKGTGLLLLAAVVITQCGLTVLQPDRSRRLGNLLVIGVAFVVIASPLLVRNLIRFGSPTYNVNSYLLWVDTYESPNALAEKMTLREARSAYLQAHSIPSLVRREATGLAWEAFIGLRTLGFASWDDSRVLMGIPLFALALLGLYSVSREAQLTLVVWTGITWIAMAWYIPIAAGDRFMMPLLIPWLTLAADGLVRWSASRSDPHTAIRRLVLICVGGGIVTTLLVWTRTTLWEG